MYYLVKDDIGTQVKVTLTRADDGSVVDLTGSTPVMKFRAKGTTTILATLSNVSTSGDQASGIAVFEFSSGDLDVVEGKYEGEVEVTFASGAVESVYEILEFYVRADF